ncbi:MAG: DUF4214 domain-containing protein [Clostridia bacterium]|nr:DUF4214 domain-containing protein [Clostridia bacterium]
MKRFISLMITVALILAIFPAFFEVRAAALITKRFDLGGGGTASGYTGVSATEGYDKNKGYGFGQLNLVENVKAKGTGALSDAVRFHGAYGNFKVDLPKGVYKITVTIGNDESSTVVAEGVSQLYFLTGNNASDSFTIPVTDGQLNIYVTSGVGDIHSISTIEIEQTSTDTVTKPTIWICGDENAASFYNVPDNAIRGWGQFLPNYIDTNKYDVRNISCKSVTASAIKASLFPTVEHYGKSGDIILFDVGYNEYCKELDAYVKNNNDPIDPSGLIKDLTSMVKSAKNMGMTVYLVRHQGTKGDAHRYPIITNKYFNKELDQIAASEKVGTLDLLRPFIELSLKNYYFEMKDYYASDDTHFTALGADTAAQMISEQLFPHPKQSHIEAWPDLGTPSVIYETTTSGQAIANPHKGYVMTVYGPDMIETAYDWPYAMNGSADNKAWDVVTIVSGSPHWEDLNPKEDVYDWSEIDEILDTCEKYGLTYGIRIMPFSSYLGEDFVPDWVYAKGAKKDTAKRVEDSVQKSDNPPDYITFPDWDDPIYLDACKKFAKALAEKYDGDPRVEFIDIRPFGDYGEWHTAFTEGNYMPSLDIQKDMLNCYAEAFDETLLVLPSDGWGEIYEYAVSLGITKRDDGLISTPNIEWGLIPAYEANLPVMGENLWPYSMMQSYVRVNDYSYINWSPDRFRETIEISHLSIFALDQDSNCSYDFYKAQKPVIDEMCNRLGYNFTVTRAELYGNKLVVSIKNTGLAPAFFNIDLCAEITDAEGNKISNFGSPILLEKGSFHDDWEKTFTFEYSGDLPKDATICLAMYDKDNTLVQGKDPTVRFDNKNNLSNNRLKLVATWTSSSGSTTSAPTGSSTPSNKPSTPTNKPSGSSSVGGSSTSTESLLSFEDFVERLYVVALNRQSEPEGKAFWCEHVGNGDLTGAQCANEFLLSKEFNDRGLNDEQFLKVLYKTFFDRDAEKDPDGFNFWMNSLKTEGRDKVVDGFINSEEWCNICASYGVKSGATRAKATIASANATAFATRLYTECLGRDPEAEGLKFWSLGLTNLELTGKQAAHEFFFSKEFNDHSFDNRELITRMYKTFMGRNPEDEGMNFWINEMKNGMTKEQVFEEFVKSSEFTQICKDYAIDRG